MRLRTWRGLLGHTLPPRHLPDADPAKHPDEGGPAKAQLFGQPVELPDLVLVEDDWDLAPIHSGIIMTPFRILSSPSAIFLHARRLRGYTFRNMKGRTRKRPIPVAMDEITIRRIDELARLSGQSRNAIIRACILEALDRIERDGVIQIRLPRPPSTTAGHELNER